MPQFDHAARRRRLAEAVRSLGDPQRPAALLLSGPANVRWASGFTGSAGRLLLLPGGEAVLVTDARYTGRARAQCPDLPLEVDRDWVGAAARLAGAAGAARLGFEGEHVSHLHGLALGDAAADAGLADVVATSGIVERARTVKDDAELELLADACRRTDAALDEVLATGLEGRTERGVARSLADAFRARDAEVGFPSIVASGPHGAVPHHEPTDRVLARGELVTIDCGARVEGYHADTTRTVAVGARPDGELAEVFAHVAAAQLAGVAAAVVGATGADVDATCRDHLAAVGLAEHFVHGSGHGIGLEVHEAPILGVAASASLVPAMALTVEPGVYLEGRGGVRVEDTVVTTTDGAQPLTAAPRELLVH